MNTNKKIYSLGIALLVAAAVRPVYAESNDMTQTRTQDHLRSQVNLQTAANEFGQASNSEQKMIFNKNQNQNQYQNQYQHQYKHMMDTSAKQSGSGEGSGSAMSGSTNRYNTTNRYSQNNGSGSMSGQSSSARSSGGGGGGRR
jgi:hypothetical protein